MEQKIQRRKTVTAAIMNIVCAGATIIFAIIALATTNIAGITPACVLLLIIGFLILGFAITLLSLSDRPKYPKGFAITLFVFDVYLAVEYFYCFILMLSVNTSTVPSGWGVAIVFVVLFCVLYIISSVFMMIDVVKSSKQQKQIYANQETSAGKLEKLDELKKTGIISEKEFKDAKTKILDNF